MRSNPLKVLALAFLVVAGATSVSAQVTNVIDWNTVWRYSQGGVLPAANWMTNTYIDTAWPSGAGALGFPVNEGLTNSGAGVNTLLSQNDTNGAYIFTYYFRTTFVLSTTNGVTLTASNLIDDGAVIYMNGREVPTRPGMPAGAIANNTQATRGGDINDAGHGIDTFNIPIGFARPGTNLVAVEVHQNGTASSDVIWAMRLVADIPAPPVIITHPQSQTVDAGRNATFTVAATGTTPLTYRWYSNSVLVATSGGTSYTTPPATLAMNGAIYYVTVSNRFGLTQSSNAVLTVELDDNGPVLILGVPITTTSNQFEVTFDEPVLQSTATNRSNYGVFMLGTTNPIAVTNVQFGTTRMRLTLDDAIDPGSNYIVCAYNMRDTKSNINITAQSCIGISFSIITNVVPFRSDWMFEGLDSCVGNTNWTSTNYSEADPNAFWFSGIATFYYSQRDWSATPPCVPLDGTLLFVGPRKHYFRKRFALNSKFGTNITAQIRHFVDDGAVFYLNGTELGRYNMPGGTILCTALAQGGSPAGNASCQTLSVPINGNALLNIGTNNVFAVEVHQIGVEADGNDDVVFDAELSFVYRQTPIVPDLTVIRSGGNVVLTWTGETNTWRVQRALSISGPWTNMVTATTTNRYQETRIQGQGQRFYRLGNP